MNSKIHIKICGITNEKDALEAARLGADFLGFVFYPPSPRNIDPVRAAEIMAEVRQAYGLTAPRAIGVFVDCSPEEIKAIRETASLDGAQLCGDETPEVAQAIQPIRFRTVSLETLDRLGQYEVEAYLCDTHAPDTKGGTGQSYDYLRLQPHISCNKIIVAGGLTPETVGKVVATLHPWGVDVSSGIEAAKGIKDHDKMRRFIEAVRNSQNK